MKSKSLKLITLLITSFIGFGLIYSTPTFAVETSSNASNSSNSSNVADPCGNDVPAAVREANGCNGSADQLPIVITNILNGVIAVTGLVSVIFVIVGGANYMSSSGETAKLQKARNTILYALIGMAICVLAFAIVNFVIIKLIGNGQ